MRESEFIALKKEHENLQRKASEAKGQLTLLYNELQEDYGVDTLERAKKLLKKMQGESEILEAEFEKALKEYRKEFGKDEGDE